MGPRGVGAYGDDYDEEDPNIVDEDSPWMAPSVSVARQHVRVTTHGGGDLGACATSLDTLADLGPGLRGYLYLAKYLMVGLWLASVVAAVHLALAGSGDGVAPSDLDVLGLARASLGNVPRRANGSLADARTLGAGNVGALGGFTSTPAARALAMTAADLVYCVLLLGMAALFARRARVVVTETEETGVYASYYSVLVRGLPPDASAMELERHFSQRFQLSDPDWAYSGRCGGVCCRKRPRLPQDVLDSGEVARTDVVSVGGAMEPLKPVSDISNTGNEAFSGCVGGGEVAACLCLCVCVCVCVCVSVRMYARRSRPPMQLLGRRRVRGSPRRARVPRAARAAARRAPATGDRAQRARAACRDLVATF